MALDFSKVRGLSSRASRFLLAGTLAAALTPAIALASEGSLQAQSLDEGTVSVQSGDEGTSTKLLATLVQTGEDKSELLWPDGKWAQTAEQAAQGTYIWDTYVKGDGAHYGHYDLSITFKVDNEKKLQSVNLQSKGKTFGGQWGTISNKSGSIMGSLPAGVSIEVDTNKSGNTYTLTPKVTGTEQYGGYELVSMDLFEIDKEGNLVELYERDANGEIKKELDPDDGDWDPVKQTAMLSKDKKSFTTVENDQAKVAKLNVKIGDYYQFGKYLSISDAVTAAAIAQFDAAEKTNLDATPSGIGSKDRDMWTQTALASICGQQLKTFMQYDDADIDIVTSATKSSDAIIEALYASQGIWYPVSNRGNAGQLSSDKTQWPDGFPQTKVFESVSDDLRLEIDGKIINAKPSYVTKNEDNRVLTSNFSEGFDFVVGSDNAVNVVGYDLFDMSKTTDGVKNTRGGVSRWLLSNVKEAYAALADDATTGRDPSKDPKTKEQKQEAYKQALAAVGAERVDGTYANAGGGASHSASAELSEKAGKTNAASYDPDTNALTVTNENVTHVIVWYNHDSHGNYAGVVYDLNALAEGNKFASLAIELQDTTSFTYNGEAFTPEVSSVKLGEQTLTEGTDYAVSYENNTNAGKASAVITGAGDYKGSVASKAFSIAPKDIAESATAVLKSDKAKTQTYTGSAITPDLTVKVGETELTSGVDYKVAWKDNTDVTGDDAKASGTVSFIGNYKGKLATPVEFEITPLAYDAKSFKIEDVATQVYSPNGSTPALTITRKVQAASSGRGGKSGAGRGGAASAASSVTLTQGKDFTVEYSNNKAAGQASAKISFTGNYSGEAEKTFTIGKASKTVITKNKTAKIKLKKVKKKAQTIKAATVAKGNTAGATYKLVKASKSKSKFKVASNGKITVKKGTKKGTYKLTLSATAAGDANHNAASKNFTVTVKVK